MLVVVNDPKDWRLSVPGIEVVEAKDYLSSPRFSRLKGIKLFNLCRSYRYQTAGYYVSLLAAARGQKPIPSLTTILDMKSRSIVRMLDDELDELIQRSLAAIRSSEFTLSIYFGHNMANRHDPLARRLFTHFPAPFLRAQFSRNDDRWRLQKVEPVPSQDIPDTHMPFVLQAAHEYFANPRFAKKPSKRGGYELAILHDPAEELPPSNPGAMKRFVKAAERVGFAVELITKEDASRIPEFDALFIRETTAVNHHTFRIAQTAAAEGLAVVDDPNSIIRCSNKVFLAETLELHEVPTPKTIIVGEDDVAPILEKIGLPCVLKYPDSCFSRGVMKCMDEEQLRKSLTDILETTELLVAQEYVPTEYDWRIGVFDREPIYACRYHMASGHWQIVHKTSSGNVHYGRIEPVPVDLVPRGVLKTAVRAARLIGDGLYGVDMKQVRGRALVIEINDNPNLDKGFEDAILGDGLYERIMKGLWQRVENLKSAKR